MITSCLAGALIAATVPAVVSFTGFVLAAPTGRIGHLPYHPDHLATLLIGLVILAAGSITALAGFDGRRDNPVVSSISTGSDPLNAARGWHAVGANGPTAMIVVSRVA